MHYPVPKEHTIGGFEVGWNRELSETDKQFIKTVYPFDPKPIVELGVSGKSVEGSIGKHGEEDTYKFKVDSKGEYGIETQGPTDVFMGLFGPNNQATLIAEDNNSGKDKNVKIVKEPIPGVYYLRVHHNLPTGSGSYKISVKLV
jgi:Bacterial pre-peptidase C-terminal domain.